MRVAQDALPTFTAKAYSFFHLTEGWRTNTNPASMIGKKSYTQQVPTPVEEDKGKKERIKKSERKRAVVSHQPLSAHRCWHDNSIRPSKGGHTTTAVYEGIVEGAPHRWAYELRTYVTCAARGSDVCCLVKPHRPLSPPCLPSFPYVYTTTTITTDDDPLPPLPIVREKWSFKSGTKGRRWWG